MRQTFVSREQRFTRNSGYPERGSYDIQETSRRSGSNRRNYSPRRNMTNASALNAEATPYNQARNSQENVTDNRTGNFRGTEWGYHTLFTSERHGGPASSVRTLVDTDTGMEMLEIAEDHLLDNKVEVTTYFINDGNMKNCPHIDIKIGNGNVKGVIDTGSEISWITEDLYANLLSQGLEMCL